MPPVRNEPALLGLVLISPIPGIGQKRPAGPGVRPGSV